MTMNAKRIKVTKTIDDVAHEQSLQIQRASNGLSTVGRTAAPNGYWVKRDTVTGRFMDKKMSGIAPFKGVRREH